MSEIMREGRIKVPIGEARNVADPGLRNPDEAIELERLKVKFLDALGKLPTDRQKTILMEVFDGILDDKSIREIAANLGISVNSLNNFWTRIRRSTEFWSMPASLEELRAYIHGRLDLGKIDRQFNQVYSRMGKILSDLQGKPKLADNETAICYLLKILHNPYAFRIVDHDKWHNGINACHELEKIYGLRIDLADKKWLDGFVRFKRNMTLSELESG